MLKSAVTQQCSILFLDCLPVLLDARLLLLLI